MYVKLNVQKLYMSPPPLLDIHNQYVHVQVHCIYMYILTLILHCIYMFMYVLIYHIHTHAGLLPFNGWNNDVPEGLVVPHKW